jgi:hypothetical protein
VFWNQIDEAILNMMFSLIIIVLLVRKLQLHHNSLAAVHLLLGNDSEGFLIILDI